MAFEKLHRDVLRDSAYKLHSIEARMFSQLHLLPRFNEECLGCDPNEVVLLPCGHSPDGKIFLAHHNNYGIKIEMLRICYHCGGVVKIPKWGHNR